MGTSKEKSGKSFFVLLDNLPPCLPGVPSSHFPTENTGMSTIIPTRLTSQLGRLKSCTITHAMFPPDNRFCVLLIQTYKAPLCCFFFKPLLEEQFTNVSNTRWFPRPHRTLLSLHLMERLESKPWLARDLCSLADCPQWKLTLHFTLLLTKYGSKFEFEVNLREHLATPATPSAWPPRWVQILC